MCAGVARCFEVNARTAGDQTFLKWTQADLPDAQKAAALLCSCSRHLHEPYIPHTHTHTHKFEMAYVFSSRSSLIASLAVLLGSVAKVVLIPSFIRTIQNPRQIQSLIISLWIFISPYKSPHYYHHHFSMPLLSTKGQRCSFSQTQSSENVKKVLSFSIVPHWIHDHCEPILRSEAGFKLKLIFADCNLQRQFYGCGSVNLSL